jgi:ribose-phosphate pyrophosphokinase
MNENQVIVSGSVHPELARKLSESLKVQLASCVIGKFPNGELRVRILDDLAGKTVILVQSMAVRPQTALIELILLADATRLMKPKRMICVIPWLAYSLQDRQFQKGEPVSAEIIAKLIDGLDFDHLILTDLHSSLVQGYFKTKRIEIKETDIFLPNLQTEASQKSIAIAPDAGALQRTKLFADALHIRLVAFEKKRNLESGKIESLTFKGSVDGKECLIFDDVIITGSTLAQAAKLLKKRGAKSVRVFCTHPIFAPGSLGKVMSGNIDEMTVSDTIPLPINMNLPRLKIVSCVPAISHILRSLTTNNQ